MDILFQEGSTEVPPKRLGHDNPTHLSGFLREKNLPSKEMAQWIFAPVMTGADAYARILILNPGPEKTAVEAWEQGCQATGPGGYVGSTISSPCLGCCLFLVTTSLE